MMTKVTVYIMNTVHTIQNSMKFIYTFEYKRNSEEERNEEKVY